VIGVASLFSFKSALCSPMPVGRFLQQSSRFVPSLYLTRIIHYFNKKNNYSKIDIEIFAGTILRWLEPSPLAAEKFVKPVF